jgi:hypothetical protein
LGKERKVIDFDKLIVPSQLVIVSRKEREFLG